MKKSILNNIENNKVYLIILTILLAAFLRIFDISEWSFTNDELSALRRTLFPDIKNIIKYGVIQQDTHPAGIQLFIYFWKKLFGNSEFAIRIPFVLASLISIILIFQLTKKWFDFNTAILTTVFITISSFFILYSQLARPYSFGLLFTSLTTYLLTDFVLLKKEKIIYYFLIPISIALSAYSHYFSLFTTSIICILFLFFANRKKITTLILLYATSFILFIPHLKITLYQYQHNFENVSWIPQPSLLWMTDFFFHLTNKSMYLLLLTIIFFLTSLIYATNKEKNLKTNMLLKKRILFATTFVIIYLTAHIFSILKTPLLQPSIMLFATPHLLIFLFSFSYKLPQKIVYLFISIILLTGITSHFNNIKLYRIPLGDFKSLAQLLSDNINKYGGIDNCDCIANINSPYYINYYLSKTNQNIKCLMYRIHEDTGLMKLKEKIINSKKNYMILAEIGDYNYPQSPYIINTFFPYIVEQKRENENKITIFSKIYNNTFIKNNFLSMYSLDYNSINKQFIDSNYSKNSEYCLNLENCEFSPDIKIMVDKNKIDSIYFIAECLCLSNENTSAVFVGNYIECNESWQGWNLKYFSKPNEWYKSYIVFEPSKYNCKSNSIQFYIWNPKKEKLFIKCFNVKIYHKNGNIKI